MTFGTFPTVHECTILHSRLGTIVSGISYRVSLDASITYTEIIDTFQTILPHAKLTNVGSILIFYKEPLLAFEA